MNILPNSCLLIIDMQYDFLPPSGSLAVTEGDEIVPRIHSLISESYDRFDSIVFTQDFHPQNHISFASNHPGTKSFDTIEYKSPGATETTLKTFKSTLWPDHCVQGTHGCEIEKSLLEIANERDTHGSQPRKVKIVQKGKLQDREYYSCFNDIWNADKTELDDYLKEMKIENVYVCGLALDFCVFQSATSASNLGYNTFIVRNMTKGIDKSWSLDNKESTIKYVAL